MQRINYPFLLYFSNFLDYFHGISSQNSYILSRCLHRMSGRLHTHQHTLLFCNLNHVSVTQAVQIGLRDLHVFMA